MATGTSGATLQIIPDIFLRAMKAGLSSANAFMGSKLAGAVSINPEMPFYGPGMIGNKIQIPQFENLGDFQDAGDMTNDGTGLDKNGNTIAIQAIGMSSVLTSINHGMLPFAVTHAAMSNPLGNPYDEAVRQAQVALVRYMDRKCIDAAVDSSTEQGIIVDFYSAGSPRYLDYDLFVDAKMEFGDFQDDIEGMVVHPKVLKGQWKLKDGIGRPLLLDRVSDTDTDPRLHGIPIISSARLPLGTNSTMTVPVATNSTGTPPVITLTGTPTQFVDLVVKCTTIGARGTWQMKWSTNGGKSWVQDGTFNKYVTSAATVAVTDRQGNATGITLNIAAGTAALDHKWTATTNAEFTSLIVKKASLAFWYNRDQMDMMQVNQPTQHSVLNTLHVYNAAARYRQCGGADIPGVVQILHN